MKKLSEKERTICFVIFLVLCGAITWFLTKEDSTYLPPHTKEDLVKKQFSSWDGHHYKLTKWIKQNMHDPDSFKHVETRYRELANGNLSISVKFRGKNPLGGLVLQSAIATVNSSGDVISFELLE